MSNRVKAQAAMLLNCKFFMCVYTACKVHVFEGQLEDTLLDKEKFVTRKTGLFFSADFKAFRT